MVSKLFRPLGILSSSWDPAAVWKIQSGVGIDLKQSFPGHPWISGQPN